MNEILILTGACGVGKSTIAKGWAKSKDGATIDCDYLTEWIYQKDFPHWKVEGELFVARLASRMAKEYLEEGMSVSIENVWTPAGIELILSELKHLADTQIKIVWLVSDIEENHRRDQQRIPENQMKGRVNIVNNELASYHWPALVRKLDTTEMDVDKTLLEIERLR